MYILNYISLEIQKSSFRDVCICPEKNFSIPGFCSPVLTSSLISQGLDPGVSPPRASTNYPFKPLPVSNLLPALNHAYVLCLNCKSLEGRKMYASFDVLILSWSYFGYVHIYNETCYDGQKG